MNALALDTGKYGDEGHYVTTEHGHVIFITDNSGIVPHHLRAEAGESKRFSRAGLERAMIAHHEEYGGGYTAHSDQQLGNFVNPFKFRGVKGKDGQMRLPDEVGNYLDQRSASRHLFSLAKPGETAQGEDAMQELGHQRYMDIANEKATGRLTAAKEFAKNSPDPEMQFLGHIHDNLPGDRSSRGKFTPVKAGELRIGNEFTIHGVKFLVAEDEDGHRVLQFGHDVHVPVDALSTVPVDEGSFRTKSKEKAYRPANDGVAPFSAPAVAGVRLVKISGGRFVPVRLALSNDKHDELGRFAAKLTGDELGKGLSDDEYREAAKVHAKEHLQGKSFLNEDTQKHIAVSGRNIGKLLSNTADVRRAKIVVAVPRLIQHGKLISSEKTYKQNDPTRAYHRFQSKVELAGVPHDINFVVREDANGHWYYNHGLGEVTK